MPIAKPLKNPPVYDYVEDLGNGVALHYSKQTKYYLAMRGDQQLVDGASKAEVMAKLRGGKPRKQVGGDLFEHRVSDDLFKM